MQDRIGKVSHAIQFEWQLRERVTRRIDCCIDLTAVDQTGPESVLTRDHETSRQFGGAVAGGGDIAGELPQVMPCFELFSEELGVTNDHRQKSI
jgi:hypothetical protein